MLTLCRSCGYVLLRPGFAPAPLLAPLEQWTKRFQEAERLVDEVTANIAERGSVPASLPLELKRRTGEIRRKVAILETRLSLMKEDLDRLPNRQHIYTYYYSSYHKTPNNNTQK